MVIFVLSLPSPPLPSPLQQQQKQEEGEEEEEEEEDDGIDWEYLSSKTEGCQARDLAKLVKRWVGGCEREIR